MTPSPKANAPVTEDQTKAAEELCRTLRVHEPFPRDITLISQARTSEYQRGVRDGMEAAAVIAETDYDGKSSTLFVAGARIAKAIRAAMVGEGK